MEDSIQEEKKEEAYNFSQHLYCVSICFDEKKVFTKYFISGITQGINRGNYIEERASILYRVTSKDKHQFEGEIKFSGAEADEKKRFYQGESDYYVDSVFFELDKLYKRMEKEEIENNRKYQYDVHDTTIIQAAKKLLEKVKTWSPLSNKTRLVSLSDYHFAITLPTNWNKKIQTKLIRPLFVEAGLITESDHSDKLLFFTQLRSDFRYLQSLDNYECKKINKFIKNEENIVKEAPEGIKINEEKIKRNGKKIVNRKKYHICLLTFTDNKLLVNLDLFSAYYPRLATVDNFYDAKLLHTVSFYATVDSKIKRYIELYIKINSLDMKQISSEDLAEVVRFISEHKLEDTYKDSSLLRLITLQESFHSKINKDDLQSEEIKELENAYVEKIRRYLWSAQSSVYEHIFYPIKNSFWKQMKNLYNYGNNSTYTGVLILRGIYATRRDIDPLETLLKWLEKSISENPSYEAITFGNDSNIIRRVPITDMLTGTANQIKNYIQKSNLLRDPSEIVGNRTKELCMFSLIPLFINSKPSFIVNIDLTFDTSVKFLCTYMGTDSSVIRSTEYSECHLMPLGYFFVELNKYQRSAVNTRIKKFVEDEDHVQILKTLPGKKECLVRDLAVVDGSNDEKNFYTKKITKTMLLSEDIPVNPDCKPFQSQQKINIHLFLVMYLRYINDSVTKKLNKYYQSDWLDKNVGYILSVEKMLLDDVFDSKNYLQQILFESGMLQETNQSRKARIVTQGEGILPIIQESLALPMSLRSYSTVVQLYKDYIQITLHQVVKLTVPSGDLKYVKVKDEKVLLKNVSDITVRDEIIPIPNAYDDMCINILNHIESYGVINRCTLHRDKDYPLDIPYSLEDYNPEFKKLKQQIFEILSSEKGNLDAIDEQQKIEFGHKCDCYFYLSLRDIIDVGFKPSLQTIATTIVSSLTNVSLFGNYGVDFIFVSGDLYNLSRVSIHKIYTNILQKAIDASIETKQISPQGFVLSESLCHLSHSAAHKQLPFLGDSLTIGKLQQASSETYGIYIGALNAPFAREHNLVGVDYKSNNANAILCRNSALIILQKGQPIPITGCVRKFKMNFLEEDKNVYNYEVLELAVIKLKHPETIGTIIPLDGLSYDKISTISIGSEQLITGMYVYLEIQTNNYNSSLQFSLRLNGSDKEYHNDNGCLILEEPLTVACF